MLFDLLRLFLCIVSFIGTSAAESHTVKFDNRCGFGTPHLLKNGKVLSKGEDFVSHGSFTSGIAYLQTGKCNLNGEGCTLVEMSLINPRCPGCGSSTDISLIPPLAFSVPTSFSYYNGCEGSGAHCSSADCRTAFFVPDDNQVQVACQDENVNLLITFCPGNSVLHANATAPHDTKSASGPRTSVTVQSTVRTEHPHATETTSASAALTPTASTASVQPARKCNNRRLRRNARSQKRMHRRHTSH